MRGRIPLTVLLVLFVAVSCDQQPLEPSIGSESELLDYHPSLNGAYQNTLEYDWSVDLCGYDQVDFSVVVHETWRIDANFKEVLPYHYFWQARFNATGVGQRTGQIWRVNSVEREAFSYRLNEDWEEESEIFNVKHLYNFVGQGSAPNFQMRLVFHSTRNRPGELVTVVSHEEPLCE
jgi:hypothetical protein